MLGPLKDAGGAAFSRSPPNEQSDKQVSHVQLLPLVVRDILRVLSNQV